jgi:hypothetical protein
MRLIGWLCVAAAPLAMTLSVLLARVNNRVYGELCGQGRIWACAIGGAEAARMWLMVAVGLLAYGILILAIRPPQHRRSPESDDPYDEHTQRFRRRL